MDAIIIERKLRELTNAAGQIKRTDLPEIRKLCRELYTASANEAAIIPLLERIEVLEETLDQFENIRKAEADLRDATDKARAAGMKIDLP